MTNQPRDLDQSDYERDGANAQQDFIDAEVARLTEHHDPIPLIDVCAMICDREGGDVDDFMKSSILGDLIGGSQSNPNGVEDEIREALTLIFDA